MKRFEVGKKCTKCQRVKLKYQDFHRDRTMQDGLHPHCKECRNTANVIWKKTEAGRKSVKKYSQSEGRKAYFKKFRKENRKYFYDCMKKYRSSSDFKLKRNEEDRIKRKEDPFFRIRNALSSGLRCRLRRIKMRKSLEYIPKATYKDYIGCDLATLKKHLEKKFEPGMTWENHGQYGWHVDHIKPCTLFDLTKIEEQKKCFHYTNLQPLWWRDNIKKSHHYTNEVLEEKQSSVNL